MCTNCAIGKKKKYGSKVGAINMEQKGMEALEVVGGAAAGAIASLEVIRMIPAATLNPDIRDGIGVLAGVAAAVFTPDGDYKALGLAAGAAITGVFAMNAYMRHFATPAIGRGRNPALGRRQYNPALGAPQYQNVSKNVDAILFRQAA